MKLSGTLETVRDWPQSAAWRHNKYPNAKLMYIWVRRYIKACVQSSCLSDLPLSHYCLYFLRVCLHFPRPSGDVKYTARTWHVIPAGHFKDNRAFRLFPDLIFTSWQPGRTERKNYILFFFFKWRAITWTLLQVLRGFPWKYFLKIAKSKCLTSCMILKKHVRV